MTEKSKEELAMDHCDDIHASRGPGFILNAREQEAIFLAGFSACEQNLEEIQGIMDRTEFRETLLYQAELEKKLKEAEARADGLERALREIINEEGTPANSFDALIARTALEQFGRKKGES